MAMGTALSRSCCGVQGEGSCRAIISVAQPVPWVEGQLMGQMAPCFLASGLTPWLLLGPGWPCLSPLCQVGDGQFASVLQLWPRASPTSPGVTAGAVPANAPADMDIRDTPIFAKQGEAGGWIAACLCPLNTGVWAHKMEEGISLLLIQSRGLLLDLLPLRRWLLSLGCSMFLGRVLLPLE